MGPITYSLCHKPVVGILMFLSTLCTFPPPVPEKEVSLYKPGVVLNKTFDAPVDKSYPLVLVFTFPTTEDRLKDKFVGSNYTEDCKRGTPYEEIPENRRAQLGTPLPLKVKVTDASGAQTVFDKTVESLCVVYHGTNDKGRVVCYIELKRGKYRLEVTNLVSQPKLAGVKVAITLVGGFGKR